MNFRLTLLSICILAAPLGAPFSYADSDAGLPAHAPNELIIKFKSYVNEQAQKDLLSEIHGQQVDRLGFIGASLVQLPKNQALNDIIQKLRTNPKVQYVEPNYAYQKSGTVVPAAVAAANDTYYSLQWGLNNTGQMGGVSNADIDAPEAWQLYKPKSVVTVAVIDTGVDYNHVDLARNIWTNATEDVDHNGTLSKADLNRKDEDKNGYADDVAGWNFVDNNSNPMDDNGHGTHVSGIIAAQANNRTGIAGVAGQGYVKILPLKFLDKNGSGYTSNAVKALEYAVQKNAMIANCSWGGTGNSQALLSAIQKYQSMGGLLVAAAGNSATNNDQKFLYPASYNLKNEIVVASLAPNDALSTFSNYGLTTVHLAAPGTTIASTVPGNSYAYMSGTSMATPYVSGVAALIWSQKGTTTGGDVKKLLLDRVRPVKALSGKMTSGGVLNAKKALTP